MNSELKRLIDEREPDPDSLERERLIRGRPYVVSATTQRVWDINGFAHRLSCGCYWFDRDRARNGTEVFCSRHERLAAITRSAVA